MKNKNFGRKRQAIYILSNRKSTRIIKTLMDFFFFIKVKIKMVCFSVPSDYERGNIMTREEKVLRLCEYCNDRKCQMCELWEECKKSIGKGFVELDAEEIDRIYERAFGTSITKNLTGVIKEDHERTKTVSDILEEVKQEMCDYYCKYPTQVGSREDLFADDSPCMTCPLNKI